MCSTLPLIKVYLPITFHADIFCITVMVLVQCTSHQRDIYTPEVSCLNL